MKHQNHQGGRGIQHKEMPHPKNEKQHVKMPMHNKSMDRHINGNNKKK